ncbi:MAG: MFS transporter [Planctomycetota bacterium]|nr:MFS transporter [Planctomycetota bacterium]
MDSAEASIPDIPPDDSSHASEPAGSPTVERQVQKWTIGTRKPLPTILRAFRHRNFRLFFAGQFISLTGTWMQSVAQAWLVHQMTGSAVLLGSVMFASQFPIFLLAPIGGTVADRVNRYRIVLTTQSVAMVLAAILAALTLTGRIEVWHIFVLASCLGTVNAFDIPARQAFIVSLVGREEMINAIALNSSMFNAARIVGPAMAGILIGLVGEAWCFFYNAVSYIGVLACLLQMKLAISHTVPPTGSPWMNMVEGFRYVAQTPPIRALILLLGVVSLTGVPYAVLMPIIAGEVLDAGAHGLGMLMSSAGVGALIGALTIAGRRGVRGLGRWVATASSCFGVSLIMFSLSTNLWLSAALLVPVGGAMMMQMAASNTLIQSMVPDRLRGRVMSVYSMMFMGMAPMGALWAGTIAESFGAPMAIALGGGLCLIASAIFWSVLPSLRVQGRELILAQQMAAGIIADDVAGSNPGLAALQPSNTAELEKTR